VAQRSRGEGHWGTVLDVIGEAPFEAALLDPAEVTRIAAETFRTLKDTVSGSHEAAVWQASPNAGPRPSSSSCG